MMVIFVVLKLGAQQKLKMSIWEWIIFPVISVILAVTLFWHYYSLIDDLVILHGAEFNSKLIGWGWGCCWIIFY
ncbi:hypothetical protein [Spiroplasma mirum]|uniref:hypothetical protein n=1 Tax=Spiroplasma mirum TaxID=2144 RepID=UPI00130D4FEF|nr:hypothetical protein [Spiroplasma atrichopogonis]